MELHLNEIEDKSDKKISIAIMSSYVVLTIQYIILIYFNLTDTSTGSLIQMLSKVIVGMVYLYALPAALERSKMEFIGAYFIAAYIFLLHYGIFPDNRTYIVDLLFPFFFMGLPSFIYALSIYDFSIFKSIMKKSGYIIFIAGLTISILVFLGNATIGAYSMSLSCYMLLPTILYIDELLNEFSLKYLILTSLSLLIIIALGSRGAVLCIIVYAILKYIRPNSMRTEKRVLRDYIFLFIGVVALLFLKQIITFINNILLKVDIRSRTLLLFLQDGIYLSGRETLYENVMAKITDNPLLGIGIAGDRAILGGSYVHNFLIEIIGNFGVILGILIIVGLIILIIKTLIIKDVGKYSLAIMWMCLGFVHLMLSSSYLTDIKFWVFMGLMISFIKSRKLEIVDCNENGQNEDSQPQFKEYKFTRSE